MLICSGDKAVWVWWNASFEVVKLCYMCRYEMILLVFYIAPHDTS